MEATITAICTDLQSSCHWVVATTIGCNAVQSEEGDMWSNKAHFVNACAVKSLTVDVMNVQQQEERSDCGLFATAFATSLVFGQWPTHPGVILKRV